MNKKLFDRYIRSLPKGAKLLEIGYGAGYNIRYLKRMRPDLEIYTIDLVDKEDKDVSVPDYVHFFKMDVLDMAGFKDNTFDCVICFHVLEHVYDTHKAVSEMRRVLKNKGIIFAECPHLISIFTPFGFNFYSTPNHIRPHTKGSFGNLFQEFSIKYLSFDAPSQFQLRRKELTFPRLIRKIALLLGLYRSVVFIVAKK